MIQNSRRGTSFEFRQELFRRRNIQLCSCNLEKQINEIFKDKSPEYSEKVLVSSIK